MQKEAPLNPIYHAAAGELTLHVLQVAAHHIATEIEQFSELHKINCNFLPSKQIQVGLFAIVCGENRSHYLRQIVSQVPIGPVVTIRLNASNNYLNLG